MRLQRSLKQQLSTAKLEGISPLNNSCSHTSVNQLTTVLRQISFLPFLPLWIYKLFSRLFFVRRILNGLLMVLKILQWLLSAFRKMSKCLTSRSCMTEPVQSSGLILDGCSLYILHTSHSKSLKVPKHTKLHPAFVPLEKISPLSRTANFSGNSESSLKTQLRFCLLRKVLLDLSSSQGHRATYHIT